MGDDGKPISHSEKLDMIFKSVVYEDEINDELMNDPTELE
jgi:hypothetical protein